MYNIASGSPQKCKKKFTVIYVNQKNSSLLEIEPREPEKSVVTCKRRNTAQLRTNYIHYTEYTRIHRH